MELRKRVSRYQPVVMRSHHHTFQPHAIEPYRGVLQVAFRCKEGCKLPVIFLMSLEMILDVEIFKNQGPIKEATLVPLVFPLLAGAGAFTTLLSLRAEYASVNIIIALVLNMIWVYFVVSMTGRVERFLGKGGIYIIRKFFGIILLAISVRLFMANITLLVEALHKT